MRVIVHTPHGTFRGVEIPEDEVSLEDMDSILKRLCECERFNLDMETGETLYMTKGMIDQSVFILEP